MYSSSTCSCTLDGILVLYLTVREDRSIVPLQNGLDQRRPANFIYPLLSRPVPENGIEEEALRGFPRISARVTHDDLSPVFLCLGDAANPAQQRVNKRGQIRRRVTVNVRDESGVLKGEKAIDVV